MLVRYFMSRNVLCLSEETGCRDALRLMQDRRIRRAPVLKDEKLLGMVSERDLLRVLPGTIAQIDTRAGRDVEAMPVSRIMTTRLVTIDEDEHIEHAASLMLSHRIGGLPVLHQGVLAGIVTESDIFRAFSRALDSDGVLRISVGYLETSSVSPDFAALVAGTGARLCGLLTYDRPGGQRLTVLRVREGDCERLIEALCGAGCNVLETRDVRGKGANGHAA